MRTAPHTIVLPATLLTAVLCALPALGGEEVVVDGVPHVRNDATPSQGTETLQLEEIWRAGGDGDDDVLFGLITAVAGDAEGNVYVMDAQLCQVHVYSPEGEPLRVLFRQGQGPGEIETPRDMVMFENGNVGLIQEIPGKIVTVDRMGNPQDSFFPGGDDPTTGGIGALVAAANAGGKLVVAGTEIRDGDSPGTQARVNFLTSCAEDGKAMTRYVARDHVRDFNDFVLSERHDSPCFWWAFTVAGDGRVYVAPDRDHYAISVFAPDGALERVIERDFDLWRRSPEEFERMRLLYDSALIGINIPYSLDIEEYEPAISYWHRPLRVGEDGSLWVLSSRGLRDQPEGIFQTYDVFDSDGHFTRHVAVACEGDRAHDAIFFVGPDQVVLVKGYLDAFAAQFGRGTTVVGEDEEPAVPEIICYRVQAAD